MKRMVTMHMDGRDERIGRGWRVGGGSQWEVSKGCGRLV
jgi:hypothetical protein